MIRKVTHFRMRNNSVIQLCEAPFRFHDSLSDVMIEYGPALDQARWHPSRSAVLSTSDQCRSSVAEAREKYANAQTILTELSYGGINMYKTHIGERKVAGKTVDNMAVVLHFGEPIYSLSREFSP